MSDQTPKIIPTEEIQSAYKIMVKQKFSGYMYRLIQHYYSERSVMDSLLTDDLRDCIFQMSYTSLMQKQRTAFDRFVDKVLKEKQMVFVMNMDKVLQPWEREEMIKGYKELTSEDEVELTTRELKTLLTECSRVLDKDKSANGDLLIRIKKAINK